MILHFGKYWNQITVGQTAWIAMHTCIFHNQWFFKQKYVSYVVIKIRYCSLSNHQYNQLVLLKQTIMLQKIQLHSNFFIFHPSAAPLSFIPFSTNFVRRHDSISLSHVNEMSLRKFIHHRLRVTILNRKDLYCSETSNMWTRYLLIFKNRFQPY